jgi:hypothetical protein
VGSNFIAGLGVNWRESRLVATIPAAAHCQHYHRRRGGAALSSGATLSAMSRRYSKSTTRRDRRLHPFRGEPFEANSFYVAAMSRRQLMSMIIKCSSSPFPLMPVQR